MFDGLFDSIGSLFGGGSSAGGNSGFSLSGILDSLGPGIGLAIPAGISAYGNAGIAQDNNKFTLEKLAQQFEQQKELAEINNALAERIANIRLAGQNAMAGAQRYSADQGLKGNREALANQAYQSLMQNILQGSRQTNNTLAGIVGSLNRGGF